MNGMQEKFCVEYVRSGNASAAYKKAGYKASTNETARASASKLLTKDNIKARVKELSEQASKSTMMDAEERRNILAGIIRDVKESTTDRMKALDILNKMDGSYINKTQVTGSEGGPVVFAWQ